MAERWGRPRTAARGFVLAELAAVAAVCLLTAVMAVALGAAARRTAMPTVSEGNLQRFAAATTAYAADNMDLYWGFSWKKASFEGEQLPSVYPDLKNRNDKDQNACIAQAIDLLRRKAGREDIMFILYWAPHIMYSQLPLYDYLGERLPPLWGVSPAARGRLAWAQDPAGFDQGKFLPMQPHPSNDNKRWPYSSSYELPPAFYDQSEVGSRMSQAGDHYRFIIPESADFGALSMTAVAFPSQKAHLFEQNQWDFKEGGTFFAAPEARTAVLAADGSASIRTTADANRGWQPNNPASPDPTYIVYTPAPWEPATTNGEPTETQAGHYRWTRAGIAGRDFGGPEVGPPP